MVVPKRAAMLLDRIMVALHHALEDNDREGIQRITDIHKSSRQSGNNVRLEKEMMQQFKGKSWVNRCDSQKCTLTRFHLFLLALSIWRILMIFYVSSWIRKWFEYFRIANRFERWEFQWNWWTTFNRWIGMYTNYHTCAHRHTPLSRQEGRYSMEKLDKCVENT